MRIVPILIATLVATALYFLVLERDAVLEFAGAETAAVGQQGEDSPGATQGVSVVAIRSTARTIDSNVVLRGQTEAARQVEVRAETSGKIVSSPLRKGTTVTEGQLLCELDPGTRQVALSEARANLAQAQAARPEAAARITEAEARLREAQINQNAASRLNEDGFASQTRVASTEAAVETARAAIEAAKGGVESVEARVQSAQAAVASAEREIERLTITAPFSGLLESDTAELGALLQPGGLCGTVIQLDPMKLVGFVPETSVDKIEVGARAEAELASGSSVEGTVSFLSRAADPQTRTFRVEIEADNSDLTIRDGQTAEILVSADGRQAHILPQSALTLNDDGDLGVRTVSEDDTAEFVQVELLRDTPRGVIVAGLADEAEVIVVGQEFVTDGVALDVTYRELSQ